MPAQLRSARSLLRSVLTLTTLLALGIEADSPKFGASPEEPPYSLEHFTPPTPNRLDEPLAKRFSMAKAVRFLDSANLHWQKERRCFTCHTNIAYLWARPLISKDDPAPCQIRKALEDFVSMSFRYGHSFRNDIGPGPTDKYATATAATLAINDSITTKKLHPLTKKSFDRLWRMQEADGSFPWGGGPLPVGGVQFGVMIVSIAAGVAPEGYAKTEAAQKGLARIRKWMANHPPKNLHEKAMLLWAASRHNGFLTPKEKSKFIAELRKNQLPDGGWSLPGLGEWPDWRYGDVVQPRRDVATADGYATGLCIIALRQAGVPAKDAAVARGVAWLKSNQRESGRWLTRSLYEDHHQYLKHRYLTHIGSAFAVMALLSCEDPPSPRLTQTGVK